MGFNYIAYHAHLRAAISKMIQESAFDKAGAQNFDQA